MGRRTTHFSWRDAGTSDKAFTTDNVIASAKRAAPRPGYGCSVTGSCKQGMRSSRAQSRVPAVHICVDQWRYCDHGLHVRNAGADAEPDLANEIS